MDGPTTMRDDGGAGPRDGGAAPAVAVDRLRLGLPPGAGARAGRIGRLVARELARSPALRRLEAGAGRRLERLDLGQVEVPAGATDGQIARRVAAVLAERLAWPAGRDGR